jgi:hypothetical protein
LECTTLSKTFTADWIYEVETHHRWKDHSKKGFIKVSSPVKMKIKEFTRDGLLKLEFNEKLIVPKFIQEIIDNKKKRLLKDLEDLKVSQDIMDIKI